MMLIELGIITVLHLDPISSQQQRNPIDVIAVSFGALSTQVCLLLILLHSGSLVVLAVQSYCNSAAVLHNVANIHRHASEYRRGTEELKKGPKQSKSTLFCAQGRN